MMKMETAFAEKVYDVVKRIPRGKVATYGDIARELGNVHLARAVGNALHRNPDSSNIPCHRVVNSHGRLAENYAFGGIEGQRKRLEEEGVSVVGNRVDSAYFQAT